MTSKTNNRSWLEYIEAARSLLLADGPRFDERYFCVESNLTEALQGKGSVEDSIALSRLVGEQLCIVAQSWPITPADLSLIAHAVGIYKPSVIFDWGTNVGNSARVFAWASVCTGANSKVYSIDLPIEEEHPENVKDVSQRGVLVKNLDVELHTGNGVDVALSLLQEHPSGVRALFHVDGDHGSDSVYNELCAIYENAKNSVILLDDCHNSGPVQNGLDRFVNKVGNFYRQDFSVGLPGKALLTPRP